MSKVKPPSAIEPRGKKGTYQYAGFGVRKSLHTNILAIAQTLQRRWDERLARGAHGIEDYDMTWGEYRKEYERYYLIKAPSSLVKLKYVLNSFERALKIEPSKKISTFVMKDCEEWLVIRMGEIQPRTVECEMKYLKPFFTKAQAKGYIKATPFADVRMPAFFAPEAKQLTVRESFTFLVSLPKREPGYELLGIFMFDTGMRRDEAAQQRIEDVDFVNGLLNVKVHNSFCKCFQCEKRAMRGEGRGWANKVKRERVIPLSPRLTNMLLSLYQERQSGSIFPFHPLTITVVLKRVYKAAGINGKVGSHTLRHTLANDMRQAGVDESVRKAILGHGKTSVHEAYMHVSLDEIRTGMKMLWDWRQGNEQQMVAHVK